MKKDDEVAIEDAVNDIEDDQQQGKAEDTSTEQPDTGLESVVYTPPRHSRKRKLIVALIIVALLVGTFMAVPFLRYGFAGLFVSKQVVLTVVDSANQKPVSDAKVSLGRYDGISDAKGRVVINSVPVGEYTVEVTKKNYKLLTGTHTVPILMPTKDTTKKIQATGRTVTFTFTNAISGQVVAGVDQVVLSIDQDPPVINTLEMIAKQHPGDELLFANGGDRSSGKVVPETEICEKYNIKMVFDAGGDSKSDSSTRINQATGHEQE